MKVLHLGKFYPIRGGVEKVMWDLTRGLGAKGVDVDMVCAILTSDTIDFKDRALIDENVEGSEVVLRFNEHARVICLPAKKKIAATMICPTMCKWVREHGAEYDIIHVHHPDPMACLALWMSGYKGRVILHWHSDILKQKKIMFFYQVLQQWMVKRADTIIGTTPVYLENSPWLQKVKDKFFVLPIGVDPIALPEYKYNKIKEEYAGKKLIYSLGRLVEYKGYEYLVEAMKYLPAEYHLAIGGRGPLRTSLERLAKEKGVQKRVTFLGWMEDDESAAWFHACDVFALSSIMKTEAFAIVQVEAMSCGKPLVSTRIPGSGVAWVNKDGVSGRTVSPCDPQALASAILDITRDEAQYKKYCEGALARYNEVFTYEKMIDSLIALYER